MERRCALCGRKLYSNSSILGLTCLKKMCLQVGITDVKNLSGINLLNDKILALSNKEKLPAKQTSYLADRYLTLSLLNEVNIDGYDNYRELIQTDIHSINKTTKLSELESFNTITLKQVAEINKQYKKYENIINKLMNGEYDEVQENLFNAVNFAFSLYYNKKPYLTDTTQLLQYLTLKAIALAFETANYNFTSECLLHALQENPDDLNFNSGDIVNEIKSDTDFKEYVSKIVKKYNNENIFNENASFSFNNNLDLAFSLHNVNISIVGEKQDNSTWNLNITLSDIYDYTELKKIAEYIENTDDIIQLGAIVFNNLAIVSTSCNVINPYNIKIEFTIENWEE